MRSKIHTALDLSQSARPVSTHSRYLVHSCSLYGLAASSSPRRFNIGRHVFGQRKAQTEIILWLELAQI
jgi:hypothetical protein